MKIKKFLIVLILSLATISQIYGLLRYNTRLPDDVMGHILYIVIIICLLIGLVIVLTQIKTMKV